MVRTAARRGADVLATALRLAGLVIVGVLITHIVLTLLDANPTNGLTMLVRDAADLVDLGLSDLFLPPDPKVAVLLSYGTAALLWYLIMAVVVRLVRRRA